VADQNTITLNTGITIKRNSIVSGTVKGLPSSKSVSNRALVLNALAGNQSQLNNLSEARDTVLMRNLINSNDKIIDVMDAGTTMRFLTAYFAVSNQNKILTGTARMKERPIFPLVNALRELGAGIEYLEKEGYPPFEIKGLNHQLSTRVKVPGNLSSQFVSALMMIGPALPSGLTIELEGKIGSRPYIEMTEKLMKAFGASVKFEGSVVEIKPGGLKPITYTIEPDWSAASYWFSFCALASESQLLLSGNFQSSTQGDQVMADIGKIVGVGSEVLDGYLKLTKQGFQKKLEWNFTDCPDLAQTVLPLCSIKGIEGRFTGLESLRIKETDRIYALQTELGKIGAALEEPEKGVWRLQPSNRKYETDYAFACYHDHRMAMGLAPLATQFNIQFDDRTVINKSYPRYWEDLAACGFSVS
jgi:3-phosphoshikimate 1-carboxyvinyltransferase